MITGTEGNDELTTSGESVDAQGGDDTITVRTLFQTGGGSPIINGGSGFDTITSAGPVLLAAKFDESRGYTFEVSSHGLTYNYFFQVTPVSIERIVFSGAASSTRPVYTFGSEEDWLTFTTPNVRGSADTLRLYTGDGDDRVIVDPGYVSAVVLLGDGNDTFSSTSSGIANIFGEAGDDTLRGGSGTNYLQGGDGRDLLIGGSQADHLTGGSGIDSLDGGLGDDSYYVEDQDSISEVANAGYDVVYATGSYRLTAGAHVEQIVLAASTGSASLNLAGNELNNTLVGNAGTNVLEGGAGDDILVGGDGADGLVGGTGQDIMNGGLGDDTYYIDDGGDAVMELPGEGYDAVYSSVSYRLTANSAAEFLSVALQNNSDAINLAGNDLANVIVGGAGTNVLEGGAGDDILAGGDGGDALVGGTGQDIMNGGSGDDTYFVDDINDIVLEAAGGGSDIVYTTSDYILPSGSAVENLIASQDGNPSVNLTGNELRNVLMGNDGANILDGKGGSDLMYGSGGADGFAFSTPLGADNVDIIYGFNAAEDKILLSSLFGGSQEAFTADMFVIGSEAQTASQRIIYDPGSSQLYYDADGAGGNPAVLFAALIGVTGTLTSSNFEYF